MLSIINPNTVLNINFLSHTAWECRLKVMTKFQIGQFKSLKQIFASLKANLTLKVKVTSFNTVQDLYMIITQLKFEGKILMVQKLLHSQGVTQNF